MSSIKIGGGDPYTEANRDKGAEDVRLVLDYSKAKVVENKEQKPVEDKKEEVKPVDGNRIAGNDRYSTAVDVSKKYYETADTVVLANGTIYADALSSSPLASLLKAPVLLTSAKSLSADTMKEITRLKAKKVVVVGGDNSVSEDVVNTLKGKGLVVERISGENRYKTSMLIAKKIKEVAPSDKALLVSGRNFADALSVSSLATEKNIPVVLVPSTLNDELKTELNNWKLADLTVVGGNSSVSEAVVNDIAAKNKVRIAGQNRYETSVLVAKAAYPKTTGLFVASGENPADALSVGAVTGKQKIPLVLVSKNKVDVSLKNFVVSNKANNVVVIGGENSVSSNVSAELAVK